jgi:hypothetical protein
MRRRMSWICLLLVAAGTGVVRAQKAACWIELGAEAGEVNLRIEHGNCVGGDHCGESNMTMRAERLAGLQPGDLKREGAHLDAVVDNEAGRINCSGTVHDDKLLGDYSFVPHRDFAAKLRGMGLGEPDDKKLEAYTLFDVNTAWIQSLKDAHVEGMTADNLIALRIFKVDDKYVRDMEAMGYATPSAEKLIAMRVQGVDPAQVKAIRAMGYQPSLDELIQMRIFKVTPDFIQRMQARGFHDLTIAKLVQIRIFDLAE